MADESAAGQWADELDEWRKGKDEAFGHVGDSPLDDEQIGFFHGLTYFPVDPEFRFVVSIETFSRQEVVEMQTSTGDLAKYERHGLVHFSVGGQDQQLTVYRSLEAGDWFLPFRDATSGKDSYGAGRYMELSPVHGEAGEWVLDFNYAYNPFCAYNERWVCPLPPAENTLSVEIRAGEKVLGH